ncbi:MAG: peptide deformylase, partial [Chitinophagaceae bacterium]
MILPILAYGSPVLRKVGVAIDPGYPDLAAFIEDMWETMYASNGVGLAAPQVNRSIRLFVIDTLQIFEGMNAQEQAEYPDAPGCKKVFINANILSQSGEEWSYNEGCLSIPRIRDDVFRKQTVVLSYCDEQFQQHTETFTGVTARVI